MERLKSQTVSATQKMQYYKAVVKHIVSKENAVSRANANRILITGLKAQVDLLKFKFKAVFENPHNYYILLDQELNIIDFNRRANHLVRKFFGNKMAAYEPIAKYLHPDSVEMVMTHCKRALNGESFQIERRMDIPGAQSTWWSFEYSPAYGAKNKIEGIIFNARDITQRKTYEAELELQYNKLREVSLMNSHDIRGPVCSIMGIMTIIKENDYQPDRQCLKFIETAADLLDKNTRNIANFMHKGGK